MLSSDDLRPVDRALLDYLNEGRVTPVFCQKRLEKAGEEYTRGYLHERLTRFVEHDHAANLMDTGVYELIADPRETPPAQTMTDQIEDHVRTEVRTFESEKGSPEWSEQVETLADDIAEEFGPNNFEAKMLCRNLIRSIARNEAIDE